MAGKELDLPLLYREVTSRASLRWAKLQWPRANGEPLSCVFFSCFYFSSAVLLSRAQPAGCAYDMHQPSLASCFVLLVLQVTNDRKWREVTEPFNFPPQPPVPPSSSASSTSTCCTTSAGLLPAQHRSPRASAR